MNTYKTYLNKTDVIFNFEKDNKKYIFHNVVPVNYEEIQDKYDEWIIDGDEKHENIINQTI